MSPTHDPSLEAIPCAAAVVVRRDGRILLVRRGRPPREGLWTLPGGRCEPGEAPRETARREVREETGLSIRVVDFVTTVVLPGEPAFAIEEFLAEPESDPDRVQPGDDAAEVRWEAPHALERLGVNAEAIATVAAALELYARSHERKR